MTNEKSPSVPSWWDRHVSKEANKDVLKASDRAGNVIGAVFSVIVILYFIELYSSSSGFFKEDITDIELGLFFWAAIFGISPSIVRATVGSRNISRPLDILSTIFVLIAVLVLLSSFPFDFEHLDDLLPGPLRFMLNWINDGVARAFMWFIAIVSLFMVPYTTALYLSVRKKLSGAA
ncbi:MAG: hypothetical protein HPY73_07280 [Methanomassiliicoccales archaeon]|nr:MAG: hypothetical protein HPY73_07280 [Methanomassiliicoccales archaeon]